MDDEGDAAEAARGGAGAGLWAGGSVGSGVAHAAQWEAEEPAAELGGAVALRAAVFRAGAAAFGLGRGVGGLRRGREISGRCGWVAGGWQSAAWVAGASGRVFGVGTGCERDE